MCSTMHADDYTIQVVGTQEDSSLFCTAIVVFSPQILNLLSLRRNIFSEGVISPDTPSP